MNERMNGKCLLRNERGVLSIDFLFAMMFAFGFAMILFAISITLAGVEISQYVTYSVSRAYNGAHMSRAAQEQNARAKFAEMMAKGTFRDFYALRWITLQEPVLGDFTSDYPGASDDSDLFVGARIRMDARVLNLNLPFIGKTIDNPETGRAILNSYLLREPSVQECTEEFNRQRWTFIKQLQAGGQQAYSTTPGNSYYLITDNGC